MKLASMKLDPKEQKKEADIAYDKPLYPWGLCVELNEDALTKLGIDKLPDADEDMTLTAAVTVTSVSARANADGEQRSLSLQITALALGPTMAPDQNESADKKLYGG